MRAYLIRRTLLVIPTLFILSIIVFLLVRFIPGDVIDAMQEEYAFTAGEIDREALERKLGLDQPIPVQYARWLGDIVLHGSLGQSLLGRFSVNEKIAGRLPVTIQLGVTALVIGLLIALPVGIYSAIRQDTVSDYLGRTVAIIGLATPNFWLALMVMLYPAIWWGWSPPMRLIRFSDDPLGNLGMFIIPGVILGTAMAAATMRLTRTMMLEVLRQDYIRTARAKGLTERRVIYRHAFMAALVSVIPVIGIQAGFVLGGAVYVETVFQWPGIGAMLVNAISQRDILLVQGGVLVVAASYVLFNLLADVCQTLLDPRLK